MKKPLRYVLSVVLMLALMLSMGTAAFADKTDSGLPVEYVSYGVGLSDEPGVDKHGLGDNDITIDGVSWKPKTSEDELYVHILDLAAAKLLRGCTDEAKELGIDYAKLYIENGLIQVKEDVPSAEAEELRAKLDKLTYAAVIGVVAGDVFDVGSGGEVKLQVTVAGFVTGDVGASSSAAANTAQETEESGLDVKGIGVPFDRNAGYDTSGVTGENFAGVTRTTIYIMYGGVTWYGDSGPDCWSLDEETPPPEKKPSSSERSGFAGVAKAADDENTYYIKIVGLSGEAEFIPVDDLATLGDDPDAIWNARVADIVGKDMEDYGKLADSIIVATDKDGNNIVMTIKLKDGTAKLEEIPDKGETQPPDKGEIQPPDGSGNENIPLPSAAPGEEPGEGEQNKTPDGYNDPEKVNRDLQYTPKDIVEVDKTGEDTADVTVRDTIVEPDPSVPDIS